MSQGTQLSPLDAARSAFERHAWTEALERFAEADRIAPLAPSDLEPFAETSWWCGQPADAIRLRERAYAAYAEAGDRRGAGRLALLLVDDESNRRSDTLAAAWMARAERHLEAETEGSEHGFLVLFRGRRAAEQGEIEVALNATIAALAIGERAGDRDLQALALAMQGSLLVHRGDVREGMRLVDEATMAAVSGELGLLTTGIVYCLTISSCRDIGDVRRASDWTEAAHRWCERQSVNGFPGVCRVHRAEIMALRGALAKAEQEVRVACDELMRWDIQYIAAEGYNEIGSIRLRMGDLPAAEEAFRQAHALGRSPEPGLALIRLAEGKTGPAHSAIQRALEQEGSRPGRVRLIPAAVDIAIAAGDTAAAQVLASELEELAGTFGTSSVRASAHTARGAVLLAGGDATGAQRELRRALDLWQEIDAPYEASRVRMQIAQAARAMGDEEGARLELSAAKATFERIGARRDVRIAAGELGNTQSPGQADEPRVTRTFLFTDIVNSTRLVAAIGDDAWADLLRWHDVALRSIVAEHGGEEIRHQGDGLVVCFDAPGRAIDCAIAIQRRLADHRRTNGFAPPVRVGVHETSAMQRGLDYAGVGVHEAARVGALAAEGEILVTRGTLQGAAGTFATGASRTVELKGIAAPVEVVSISWR